MSVSGLRPPATKRKRANAYGFRGVTQRRASQA